MHALQAIQTFLHSYDKERMLTQWTLREAAQMHSCIAFRNTTQSNYETRKMFIRP